MPLSRDYWSATASKQREVADALHWLLERSIDTTLGEPEEDMSMEWLFEISSTLRHLFYARIFAETKMGRTEDQRNSPASEYLCLLETLRNWICRLRRDADVSASLSSSVRRGRPRSSVGPNPFVMHAPVTAKPSRKRTGRPTSVAISDEELISRMAELQDAQLSLKDKGLAVAIALLQQQGKHTTGSRPDAMAGNLVRRFRALKQKRGKAR